MYTGGNGRHKQWRKQENMAERSRGVYLKLADTSSGVHRRRWQIQEVVYTGEDGRYKQRHTRIRW